MIKTIHEYGEEILKYKNELNESPIILFRGQTNHEWTIKSSLERELERHREEEITCEKYYRIIDRYKPLMNPFIEKQFERKTKINGYPFDFNQYEEGSWKLPEMDYMAYLRHHGFPTPTIDFSRSCFIALFFACADFNQDIKVDGKVFLCAQPRVWTSGNNVPDLRRIGRYVEAGKRHLAQQSEYLISTVFNSEWKFITFKKATDEHTNNYEFREITISKDTKAKLMKELNEMNINQYTMFLDEDSLIKSFGDDWALEKV
jgi:hypothetical protein